MHRDFTAATAEAIGDQPTFTFRGQWFLCVPHNVPLPAGVLYDLYAAPERTENERAAVAAMVAFIDSLLDRESARQFAEMIRRPWSREWWPVQPDEVEAVADWLVEIYTGRPTPASDLSSEASPPTSPSSKPISSSTASSSPPVDLEAEAQWREETNRASAVTEVLNRTDVMSRADFFAASSDFPPASSSPSPPRGT